MLEKKLHFALVSQRKSLRRIWHWSRRRLIVDNLVFYDLHKLNKKRLPKRYIFKTQKFESSNVLCWFTWYMERLFSHSKPFSNVSSEKSLWQLQPDSQRQIEVAVAVWNGFVLVNIAVIVRLCRDFNEDSDTGRGWGGATHLTVVEWWIKRYKCLAGRRIFLTKKLAFKCIFEQFWCQGYAGNLNW